MAVSAESGFTAVMLIRLLPSQNSGLFLEAAGHGGFARFIEELRKESPSGINDPVGSIGEPMPGQVGRGRVVDHDHFGLAHAGALDIGNVPAEVVTHVAP